MGDSAAALAVLVDMAAAEQVSLEEEEAEEKMVEGDSWVNHQGQVLGEVQVSVIHGVILGQQVLVSVGTLVVEVVVFVKVIVMMRVVSEQEELVVVSGHGIVVKKEDTEGLMVDSGILNHETKVRLGKVVDDKVVHYNNPHDTSTRFMFYCNITSNEYYSFTTFV